MNFDLAKTQQVEITLKPLPVGRLVGQGGGSQSSEMLSSAALRRSLT